MHGESVVDLDTEMAHRALDLLVPQPKLHCPQVASAAVDEFALVQRSECVPKKLGHLFWELEHRHRLEAAEISSVRDLSRCDKRVTVALPTASA
jgi:hypothetical protein